MEYATYGYARVSSKDQNLDRQVGALAAEGIDKSRIFMDKQSGKDFDRPAYKTMCNAIQQGDTIVITSIDRLGRTYSEVLDQWRILTKDKKAIIRVLDMPLLNTAQSRDLTQTLIADIVLQLLSYVAEIERMFIRRRQAEGIAAAKAHGVRFGAPAKKPPDSFSRIASGYQKGNISERKAAKSLGVSRATFKKWFRKHLASPK